MEFKIPYDIGSSSRNLSQLFITEHHGVTNAQNTMNGFILVVVVVVVDVQISN